MLVRRPSLCQFLLQLDGWRQLAAAFAGADAGMMHQLHQKMHRALAKALCMAAAGLPDEAQAQQYVLQVMGGSAGALAALAGRQDLKAAAGRADVQLQVRAAGGCCRCWGGGCWWCMPRCSYEHIAVCDCV